MTRNLKKEQEKWCTKLMDVCGIENEEAKFNLDEEATKKAESLFNLPSYLTSPIFSGRKDYFEPWVTRLIMSIRHANAHNLPDDILIKYAVNKLSDEALSTVDRLPPNDLTLKSLPVFLGKLREKFFAPPPFDILDDLGHIKLGSHSVKQHAETFINALPQNLPLLWNVIFGYTLYHLN